MALIESRGRPLPHVAHELGIQPAMLRAWRKRLGQPGEPPRPSNSEAPGPLAFKDQAAEIARLKQENDRLRMEKEILKKHCPLSLSPRNEISDH